MLLSFYRDVTDHQPKTHFSDGKPKAQTWEGTYVRSPSKLVAGFHLGLFLLCQEASPQITALTSCPFNFFTPELDRRGNHHFFGRQRGEKGI